MQRDATERNSGKASLRMDFNVEKELAFWHINKVIEVQPKTQYLLSLWYKTELESGYAEFEVQDARKWWMEISSK